MFKDAEKYVSRKIHKLEYIHTPLPDGYEASEAQYRPFRDHAEMLKLCVEGLLHYETGGKVMKQVFKIADTIPDDSKMILDKWDVYAAMGRGADSMKADSVPAANITTVASFSAAYHQISECKKRMNDDLQAQHAAIKELLDRARSIDQTRMQVANLRYDLEKARQASPSKPQEETAKLEREYADTSKAALDAMIAFNGDHGMEGILQKIATAHREFAEREVEALAAIGTAS